MSRFFPPALAVAVGLAAAAGCGRSQGQLSGTVTFKGKPVESGEILLTPDDGRGNRGPGVMAEIKDGAFRTPPQRGHWGGAYLARVTGYQGREALFSSYEMKIDLPEGDATYDFAVPASAAK
jgi:hypothetical protein